jgi:hypothetical protein
LFVQRNDAPSICAQSHSGFVAVDVASGNAGALRSAPAICSLHRKRFACERIEHAPMIASAIEIRCFMILETSDAREVSNLPSIRTRRFHSRDDFFI